MTMDATNRQKDAEAELREVELFVSKALRFGVLVSAVIILFGLIRFIHTGEGGYPGHSYPTSIKEFFTGALQLKPFAIIQSGLFCLILTPVLRVGVSILVFLKEKDWLYVGISSLVFLILLSSLLFGK